MKKIKIPSNLTSLAYDSIKRYILEGKLDEGARLTEEFLATTLGISKSPIREALNRLETEGLIRIEPRRGAYLKEFTSKDVNDLYGLREALETYVVRTAELSAGLVSELKQSVRRMRAFLDDNDKARYIDEDMRFHETLATATSNEQLVRTLENVQNRIWIFRRKTYDLSSTTASPFHEAIVAAIEAGDRRRAEKAMTEHIETVRHKLLEFIEQAQIGAPAASRAGKPRAERPDFAHALHGRAADDTAPVPNAR